jgi:hypothetical protein
VAEQADRAAVAVRAHALVGALVEVALLAGGGILRVELLVLEQDRVAVAEDVADVLREVDVLLQHGRRLGGRRDRHVENLLGGLDVL